MAVKPFAPDSVSMKLYVHDEPAPELLDAVLRQAHLVEDGGFDGIVFSEHHCGFGGYFPDPLLLSSWVLEDTERLWAAPLPMLILLRPTELVVEQVAWLAVRHRDRLAVGFAAGAVDRDFALVGRDKDQLTARFRAALARATAALQFGELGALDGDPALAWVADAPVGVLSAASSSVAAARAGELGCGVVVDSQITIDRARRYLEAYRGAGGTGPQVLVRRVWVGEPPTKLRDAQLALYRSTVSDADYNRDHWSLPEDMIISGDADDIADRLAIGMRVAGATSLNLRVHMPGLAAEDAEAQIAAFGAHVLPGLRERLGDRSERESM